MLPSDVDATTEEAGPADVGGEGDGATTMEDVDAADGDGDEEAATPGDDAADATEDATEDGEVGDGTTVIDSAPDQAIADAVRPEVGTVMPSAGLIQYFSFDEGASADAATAQAIDGSPRRRHAKLFSAPTWITDGQVNGAIRLDGKTQYLELQQDLLLGLNAATVACWYRVYVAVAGGQYSASWQRVFDFGSGVDNWWYFAPKTWPVAPQPALPRTATFHAGVPVDVFGLEPVPGNEWHHVAVVWTSDQKLSLYQDGNLVGSGEVPFPLSSLGSTTRNWIGRSQYNEKNDGTALLDPNFHGDVDEFRVYDRALDANEVLTLAWQGR